VIGGIAPAQPEQAAQCHGGRKYYYYNFHGIAFLEMTELRLLNQLFGAMRALDYVTGQIHSIKAGVLIETITKLMFANSARLRKQSRPVA